MQLQRAAKTLEGMAVELAAAKQVKEFNHDRCKQVLSICVAVFLEGGESAAAAEHKARASNAYGERLIELQMQYRSALETIEKADAAKVLFEAARSLLSVERAKIGLL